MTEKKLLKLLYNECIRQHYTVYELSKKAGLAPTTLFKWINGYGSPRLYHLCKVADALGLELTFRRKRDAEIERK